MTSRKLYTTIFMGIIVTLSVAMETQKYYPSNSTDFTSNDPDVIMSEAYYDPDDVENEEKVTRLRAADDRRKRNESGSNIIKFPDDHTFQERYGDGGRENVGGLVPICSENNFCEQVPNYPTGLVNQILSDNPSLKNFAIRDVLEISRRLDFNDEELCNSREQLIYPKSARNSNGDWLFIAQSMEASFIQAIRVEICEDPDEACLIIDGLTTGYSSRCRQKYVYRRLTAISHAGNLIQDFFPFPSSCCCHLVKDTLSS